MELKKLLVGIDGIKAKGNLDIDIEAIESNSKNIKNGYVFVAIKGYKEDGHKYINEAIENGAVAIVIEEGCDIKSINVKEDLVIIMVKNTREALAKMSASFYGNPSTKFKLIGVTGTKGKTTTTFMIKQIMQEAGKKVGLIGTIATYINDEKITENDRTTPESIELQKTFKKMADENVEIVVMEVSSQSLKLHRVDGVNFDIVIFTNLSEDHISPNEHENMQEYFNTKLELFKMCKTGIVNTDDLYGAKIPNLFPENDIMTYGIDNYAKLLAKDITVTNSYVDFKVKLTDRNERVKAGIPGRFSVYNSLAAICVAQKFGISKEVIQKALWEVRVPGRSELVVSNEEKTVMIDYAHTPESLENILQAIKTYTRGRVICVFGCGGDRDKKKRPMMGEVAGKVADYTIVTSDNPRGEDPKKIIEDIKQGINKTKGKYEVIVDRTLAIKKALTMSKERDIVLLAGKGHEMYQEIKGKKIPYDERKIIKDYIAELEEKNKLKEEKSKLKEKNEKIDNQN